MQDLSSDLILQRMMTLHPKVIDLTLGRVHRLLEKLDHPEQRIPPVVHIAGTNGKGSTQAMIRAGLEGAGASVHAYTSPHLVRFHERIRIAGDLISEADLTAVLDTCAAANGEDAITYFEITTCAAFLAFARHPADYTLLEVGLGGRLDATNVVTPRLSIITPVSLDHQQFLGDTIEQIAGEKAGILKRDVPAIIGLQSDAALSVIEAQAARVGAPIFVRGQHWHVAVERERLVYQDERGLLDVPLPALAGPHQIENAGMALAALRHLGCDEAACDAAMTQVTWPARMQVLRRGPLKVAAPSAELILDGGHNPAAGETAAATLRDDGGRSLYLIVGMLNTKDVSGYLRPLAAQATALYGVSIPGQSATLPADATVAAAQSLGLDAQTANSALSAVKSIVAKDPGARIFIGGSLYFAGAILADNS